MAFIPTTPNPVRLLRQQVSLPSSSSTRRRSHLRFTPARMSLQKVVVAGAAGRTGSLVFNLLTSSPQTFAPTAFVRDIPKATQALGPDRHLVQGNVNDPQSIDLALSDNKDALIILTSAIPRMNPPVDGQPPSFYYDPDGMPEQVDWIGSRNLIDAALRQGISHCILVGSMGSTEDNNPLNKLGNGNILKFKRKAQLYLIESGLPYTIINPGGLLTEPPNQRELVGGEKDQLFSIFERRECGIPRADVARVVVAALTDPAAKNKVLDVVAKPMGQGTVTTSLTPIFEQAPATL